MSGLTHLYTGDGKGKTTAALGLSLRFAGHGRRVLFLQLCKGSDSGELSALRALSQITLLRNSRDYGFWKTMSEESRAACLRENNTNLETAIRAIAGRECELLVLDEVCPAYENEAASRAMIERIVFEKPHWLELALTGRNAPAFMLEAADYISEIKCIRHPYQNGISAREGAEL